MTLDEVKEKINNLIDKSYRTNSRIVRIESWITIEDLIMILATLEDGEQFNQLNKVKTMKNNIPIRPLKYDDCEQFVVQCVCGKVMDSRMFNGKCDKCGQLLDVNAD